MTQLFCKSVRRTRVLLYILLAASVVSLAASLYGAIGAYGAGGMDAFRPLAREFISKSGVYALILLALYLEKREKEPFARILLTGAFAVRAAAGLQVMAETGNSEMMTTVRNVTVIVAALGVPIVLLAKNIGKAPKSLIGVFNIAALVSAFTVAYFAVIGTLDGDFGWIEGLVGRLPECLLGIVLAVFFSAVTRPGYPAGE